MSNSARRVRRGDKQATTLRGNHSKASHDLRRLQSLLCTNRPSEVAALSHSKTGRSQSPLKDTKTHVGAEAAELENFSVTYRELRCFSSHPLHNLFSDILESLVKNRLCREWLDQAPPESALGVLTCLRLLIRDPHHQKVFHRLQGVTLLAEHLESVAAFHASCDDAEFAVQTLVTMTYCSTDMFQKLSATERQRVWVIEAGAHRTLVKLLSTTEGSVLLGALLALVTLAEGPEGKEEIGELQIVENLLVILQEYDMMSKRVSAELLRLLCPVPQVREQLRQLDGLPVLLGLLHGQNLKLLWSVSWVLVQLCQDSDTRAEIRGWGGVPLLLRLLNSDTHFVSDRLSMEKLSSANAAGRIPREEQVELGPQEAEHDVAALQAACCAALTELSLDNTSAHHIVQENGVFTIAKLILQPSCGQSTRSLQCYAFRALRFLFSVERNRHLFKRLFPTDLFELFIDVGHYVRDLAAYQGLQTRVSRYTEEELDVLQEGISAVDQNRPALRLINGYSILEHLGSGAFGSVFKVRKQTGQNHLALKEINLHNPAFGKDKRSRESSVETIIAELSIMKEQMIHPNIVKYYKTFVEGERLYIVMELIQGAPLAEHVSSLKEKQQRFTEDRIWSVFIQLCLALRYLHKEKRIVHRDLTPNNIMLGEEDKVTITDFGLAKQKQENSKLTSVVGTILYSCPEVVKNEPYGEKADVWALGCVLYQMATLQPPFYSSNMLTLASKIVEAIYEPIEEGLFSQRLEDMIRMCLSPDADVRPDIVAVSSRIADLMMLRMDALHASHNAVERRAERDRKRAQKYFLERHRNGSSCRCSTAAQESSVLKATCPPSVSVDARSEQDVCAGLKSPADVTPVSDLPGEDAAAAAAAVAARLKPKSVSAGICISQRQLRQIDDPAHKLLLQIHKIIYITQHCVRRRIIERFKRTLFGSGSDAQSLKAELSKLIQASPETTELGSGALGRWPPLRRAAADTRTDGSLRDGVTYEQMQGIIEELLEDSSYYEVTPSSVNEKRREVTGDRSDRRPQTSS